MKDELRIEVGPPQPDVGVAVTRTLSGWTSIRLTRGAESIPNDFSITTTERFPAQRAANIVQPQDEVSVFIGEELVLTGYVDQVLSSVSSGDHSVTVSGRGKCQDLVDCSAEWPGGLVSGTDALDLAKKLCRPYGISAARDRNALPGPGILTFPLNYGETAWDIIDRVTRAAGLLAYEDVSGNLYLSQVGSAEAGSDFQQGINVQAAASSFSATQRYSEYIGVGQSINAAAEVSESPYLFAPAFDTGVIRHRRKVIVAETIGGQISFEFVDTRVKWEANRRNGRSRTIRLMTDSWRDALGGLYAPNTRVHVSMPIIKIDTALEPGNEKWIIGEVTYLRDPSNGTTCELTIMPPSAYAVLPTPLIVPPPDVKTVVPR